MLSTILVAIDYCVLFYFECGAKIFAPLFIYIWYNRTDVDLIVLVESVGVSL